MLPRAFYRFDRIAIKIPKYFGKTQAHTTIHLRQSDWKGSEHFENYKGRGLSFLELKIYYKASVTSGGSGINLDTWIDKTRRMPRTKAPHRCQMILDNTIKTTQWREVRSSNRARNTGKLHTKEWTWDLTCIKQKSSGCQRIWSTGWKCNLWGMDVRKMIWRISNRQTLRLISDFKADHGIKHLLSPRSVCELSTLSPIMKILKSVIHSFSFQRIRKAVRDISAYWTLFKNLGICA